MSKRFQREKIFSKQELKEFYQDRLEFILNDIDIAGLPYFYCLELDKYGTMLANELRKRGFKVEDDEKLKMMNSDFFKMVKITK